MASGRRWILDSSKSMSPYPIVDQKILQSRRDAIFLEGVWAEINQQTIRKAYAQARRSSQK